VRAVATNAFTEALTRVRGVKIRPEFALAEGPAPQRLAPDAVCLTAEAIDDEETDGRFVLLHDPDGHEEWGGNFRVVVFIRTSLDEELVLDPMLPDVAWSWVSDALTEAGAHADSVGGTVTRNIGQSFGTLADRLGERVLEIRASWTPVAEDDVAQSMERHVHAWISLLAQAAGMPRLAADVPHVGRRMH
jgi:hypothetical protein